MGGKGSEAAPPPTYQPQLQSSGGTDTEMMQMMMQMMAAQAAMAAMAAMPPAMPEVPPIYTDPKINWEDKVSQLNQKMKADYAADRRKKKGLSDTVLTGSLLDEEEPVTTNKSLLAIEKT